MSEASWIGGGRESDIAEVVRRAVTSPANLASFGERGFRMVVNGRVLDELVLKAGLDRRAGLVAARKAIEEVGGLVVGSRTNEDVPTLRPSSEVWMIPETAVLPGAMPPLEHRPRAA